MIFTTYHSLRRVQEAEIEVDTIYFDEAHNSVQKNFVEATEYHSMYANRCYFFTATPKHSKTPFKIGMNDEDIYGKVLANVPAPQLVEEIFAIVKDLNQKEKVSFLLAEQNTTVALKVANFGYILENGRVVMEGSASELSSNEDVKEFYLGLGEKGRKSYKDTKNYRRRKRWLT